MRGNYYFLRMNRGFPFSRLCYFAFYPPVLTSFARSFSKPAAMAENTAYFRHTNGEDNFHVTFKYVNTSLKINKQFNFCRRITENTGTFLSRVNASLDKCLGKKEKRKKACKKEVDDKIDGIETFLLLDGTAAGPDFLCSQVFLTASNYALLILGQTLPIQINVPWVEIMTLPKGMMAGFQQYPSKFEAFFTKEELSEWSWSRSKTRGGPWTQLSDTLFYSPSTEDVGSYLRLSCWPKDEQGRKGPEFQAIATETVGAGPGPLPCDNRHKLTVTKAGPTGFRVVSYNILADLYVDSEYSKTVLFGYCPTFALDLSYRRQLLLKETLGYNADILCLQEVDLKVFKHDLLTVFKANGLDGQFSPKGSVSEGTAIFYNRDKFQSVLNWRVRLSEAFESSPLFEDIRQKLAGNELFLERIKEKPATLQIILLRSLDLGDKMILVANTHLYFHPDADHVRLFQAVLCTTYLDNLLKDLKNEYPQKDVSLIWCGDFNSTPECGIYSMLTGGSVSENHIDWSSNTEESVTGLSYSHNLNFISACGTPEFTNYTLLFKACLDYIFYSASSITVDRVVPLPSNEELALHEAIPSLVFPSDHVSLVVDLKWKNSS